MAFVLKCQITIGKYRTDMINEVRIEKSWRELGDSCTIKVPVNFLVQGQNLKSQDIFSTGMKVTVKLWYDGLEEHTEFEGYVKRISPNVPFEVECEDNVYLFRKTNLSKSWKSTTLKEIVRYIAEQVNAKHNSSITISGELPAVNFKQFRLSNVNAAQALQKLKEEYGLSAYFQGNELFVGLAYQQDLGRVKYSLAWNVVEYDLEEKREEDYDIKVKAIGIRPNNTKIEVQVGDKNGEQRTIFKYNVNSKAELETFAKEEMKKLKYTGFDGTLTTLLYPYAEPLMTAELKDPEYNNKRAGIYVIDSVTTVFGESGATREVELGVKVSV
jgi:hypothetical protein